jgi:hypothetical protein
VVEARSDSEGGSTVSAPRSRLRSKLRLRKSVLPGSGFAFSYAVAGSVLDSGSKKETGLPGRSSKLGFVGGIGVRLRPTDYAVTGFVQNRVSNEAWWAAWDSTSARDGHRDQRRGADGWRRRLVTGRIRRGAAPEGRERPRTTGLKVHFEFNAGIAFQHPLARS